jgi:hypothetical protein
MAKKQSILYEKNSSSESYIKTRSRNIPIYETYINNNWKEDGAASIFISRKHSNGNITVVVYFVDIFCVGIMDTFYGFNMTESKYREMLDNRNERVPMSKIDYVLAHNIIYGAVEYAESLNISQHKDFNRITKYFLEEDTEDIEIIEIEFGFKGKPLFVGYDFYNPIQIQNIIKQLEKSVGVGNFDFMLESDFDEDEEIEDEEIEDFDEEDFDDDVDQEKIDEKNEYYKQLSSKERSELFLQLVNQENDKEHFESILLLTKSIYDNDLTTKDQKESLISKWDHDLNVSIDDGVLVESMQLKPNDDLGHLVDIVDLITVELESEEEKVSSNVKKLIKNHLDNPYFCYFDTKISEKEGAGARYHNKVNKYYSLFPDYPLLKIEHYRALYRKGIKTDIQELLPSKIFYGREAITSFEMYQYLLLKMLSECPPNEFNTISAIEEWVLRLPLQEEFVVKYLMLSKLLRMEYLLIYLDPEEE